MKWLGFFLNLFSRSVTMNAAPDRLCKLDCTVSILLLTEMWQMVSQDKNKTGPYMIQTNIHSKTKINLFSKIKYKSNRCWAVCWLSYQSYNVTKIHHSEMSGKSCSCLKNES